jgi:predicted permease
VPSVSSVPSVLSIDAVLSDIRSAIRTFRRSPAFTLTAILTLGLVIGANSAVFSLADAILLRPLPYPEPDRLATIVSSSRSSRGEGTSESQDGTSWETIRDQATTIDVALTASGFGSRVNLVVDSAAASVSQARVSTGFFRVIGVPLLVGREFTRDEDRPGGPAVAVISHGLWQRAFRGDPNALGRTLLLRGEPYQVVGIMPETFRNPGAPAEVWTPARPARTGEGGGTNFGVFGRIRDGYTWDEASAELARLGLASFSERLRDSESAKAIGLTRWWTLVPLQRSLVEGVRQPIAMLSAGAGLVLLIACVNLAGLLLARGDGRSREIATRMALGSGRAAVVRQLAVESVVLGLAGGALGVAMGALGLQALQAIGGDSFREWRDLSLDGRALAVTAGLSILTSVLFGLLPALQAGRFDVTRALMDGGSRGVAGGARHWGRRILVGAEVALGVVLLVVTGLLVRTFVDLQRLDPGFDATHVTTASVSLQDARYTTAAHITRLFDRSLEELERTPGVEHAAVSLELPYKRLLNSGFQLAGDTGPGSMANFMYVTPEFFATLRIPVLEGRAFTDRDREGAPLVAVVNDTFKRSWGKAEPVIGRRFKGTVDREIVGVVGDVMVTMSGIDFPGRVNGPLMTTPLVFLPAAQVSDGFFRTVHTWFSPTWSVRAAASINSGDAIRRAIAASDPLLPVIDVRSMAAVQSAATSEQRLLMLLVGVLAAAAVALSAVGLYGLIAHSVSERTREIGIRMALGATPAATIRAVTLSGLTIASTGAIAGIALAWGAARLVDASIFLWGVSPHDPLTYASAAILLVLVAGIASLVPALRLLRLNPASTLRD